MNLLVLGGTIFLGRHVVAAALAAGHTVAVLNRGRRPAEFSRPVEQLRGDRDADMSALQGRSFDAVIDCSGYTPAHLQRTAQALGDRVAHYVFVSSISVLAGFAPGLAYDETAPVTQDTQGYGGEKARAEEAIEAAYPGRVAHVRPGLIVGPYDPTGRFTYWPVRVARGGKVLAPGRPERLVQVIDARDLAAWCVRLADMRTVGVFHAVGPTAPMAELLATCRTASGSDARFVWCKDEDLVQAQVTPWAGLPLWIPEADPDFGGMLLANNTRAIQAGLLTRPWADTVRDTLDWALSPAYTNPESPAMKPDAESALLASLRQT